MFSIERDVRNQGKTTIKVNVQVGKEILGKIDMPEHHSALKEPERGRLLYYVTFRGGHGYLDSGVFLLCKLLGTELILSPARVTFRRGVQSTDHESSGEVINEDV